MSILPKQIGFMAGLLLWGDTRRLPIGTGSLSKIAQLAFWESKQLPEANASARVFANLSEIGESFSTDDVWRAASPAC